MPTPIRQFNTQTHYLADGVTTAWPFAFTGGYIDPSHVRAQTKSPAGALAELSIDPENDLIGEFQLRVTPPVPDDYELIIYRATPRDLPLVDFSDGSQLPEVNLDILAKQSIFVAAESADWLGVSSTEDLTALAIQAGASAAAALASQNAAATSATSANAASATAVLAASAAASSQSAAAASAVASAASAASTENSLAALGAQMLWFVTSPTERAAIVAGTSATDHTALIQSVLSSIGPRALHFGDAGQWNISATLNVGNRQTLCGKARIRAINSAAITGAMIRGSAVTGAAVYDLELDANGANNGANYGIWFTGGSFNTVARAYVHDTRQAGVSLEDESGSQVIGNRIADCGRSTSVTGGGATDNHGVMVYSIATTGLRNIQVYGNTVTGAYRKGITTYSATPGIVTGVNISGNICSGCGTVAMAGAGVYAANAPGGNVQDGVTVAGNICTGNYVNFDLNNVYNLTGAGNISRGSVGAHGVIIGNCQSGSFQVVDYDARTGGIKLDTCSRFSIDGCVVVRPNRAAGGFGAGIELASSAYCTAIGVSAYDESSGNLMTHGIIESGACDHNHIVVGRIANATAANVTRVGANTLLLATSSNRYGVNVATPLDTLHIAGTATYGEAALTLANGANQNVLLPANAGTFVVNSPSAAYSIGGIQGGLPGREIVIINYTGQVMTMNHADAGSSAGNRLALKSNTALAVPTLGAVRLRYSSIGGGAWFITE